MKKKRILFVVMQNSPHAMRWINQLNQNQWEIFLYPIHAAKPHPDFQGISICQPSRVVRLRESIQIVLKKTLFKWMHLFGIAKLSDALEEKVFYVLSLLNMIYDDWVTISYVNGGPKIPIEYGPKRLAQVIKDLKPDLVHSLEFQHCGYCVLAASEVLGNEMPTWAASNWGSDIYFYQQFLEDRELISRVLQKINFYFSECQRDIDLALTFNPNLAPSFLVPASGGFNLEALLLSRSLKKPSERRLIMVKGYESFAGRALVALAALKQCAKDLEGFQVLVYSASPEVRQEISRMKKLDGIDIEVLEKVLPDQMMKLFCQARVYLGVSVSDGISISMLEAMACGTFPIQTNTSCCQEWIVDGQSGYIISPDDLLGMVKKIQTALHNDELVNLAHRLNWEIISERLDEQKISAQTQEIYQKMVAKDLQI